MTTKKAPMILAMLVMFSPSITASGRYEVVGVWPEVPHGWHFNRLSGIAVDKAANVYVCDAGNFLIKKFDSNGRFLMQWGSAGEGDRQFGWLESIKVDYSGNVYAIDSKHSRVQKFNRYGRFMQVWSAKDIADEQLLFYDIAIDSEDVMFIVSVRPGRILKCDSGGKLLKQWGSRGSGDGEFILPNGVAVDSSSNVYVTDRLNHRVQKFDSNGKFLTKWGANGSGDGLFRWPWGIVIDALGNVYVGDFGSIQKFTPEGKFLARWVTAGKRPMRLALDAGGNMFVANRESDNVMKLTLDGQLVEEWGSGGNGKGQVFEPGGIAVDDSGYVYVAQTQKDRLQKFDSEGKFIRNWSMGPGIGGTNFWDCIPRALTTDASGHVHILSYSVQKFTSDGKLIAKWGREGKKDGQFHGADGIAIDRFGNIYVADTLTHRVQKLTSQGEFVTKWGTEGTENGQFRRPKCITIDQSGNVLVADTISSTHDRIQKFDSEGKFIAKWTVPYQIMTLDQFGNSYGLPKGAIEGAIEKYDSNGNRLTDGGNWDSDDGKLGEVGGIFVDTMGHVFVTDASNGDIKKFDPDGRFMSKWMVKDKGLENSKRESSLAKITVDKYGNMYVTDDNCTYIRKITPDGELAAQFQMEPPESEGEFWNPRDVAIDSHGNIYVSDLYPNNWRIQKLHADESFSNQWSRQKGIHLSAFYDYRNYPGCIAVDGKGNTYVTVVEGEDHHVCKCDVDGKVIGKWGVKGTGDGEFDTPEGIAVDKSGNVYVCDRQNSRIQKFDSDGKFLAKWGKEGSDDGEFHFPAAVAVDKEGNVFVADSDNSRIQKFTPEGEFLTKWGEFGEQPGQFRVPLGIAVDASGNVYVSDSHNHRIQKFAPVSSR